MKLTKFISLIKDLNIKDNSIEVKVDDTEISGIKIKNEHINIETFKNELTSLSDHNKENIVIHGVLNSIYNPIPNGIECPLCGTELFDMEPGVVYLSSPPKTKVSCSNCHYSGTRIC